MNRVTIHAIDHQGNHRTVAVNGLPDNHYWLWLPSMQVPEVRPAEIIQISDEAPQNKPVAMAVYMKL